MPTTRHAEIEKRAYLIWEAENRPLGQALDHWLRAEAEVGAEGTPQTARARVTKPRRPVSKHKS